MTGIRNNRDGYRILLGRIKAEESVNIISRLLVHKHHNTIQHHHHCTIQYRNWLAAATRPYARNSYCRLQLKAGDVTPPEAADWLPPQTV
jgi:hypothetical protein